MKILYAGDSPLGGPANYLLVILKALKANFIHIPPEKILKPPLFKRRFDAIILSDFPKRRLPRASEKLIVDQVKKGTGLLMVGGWASFSGPFGGWRGSAVEGILPVSCLSRDDRVHFPGGAFVIEKQKHPMFRGLRFNDSPVICGLNQIRPRKNSLVLLGARRIKDRKEFPLLVIDPTKRIAALATDLAPHWCGGLMDWGNRRIEIRVKGKISIEVGDLYARFVSSLFNWLARD